MSHIKIPIRGMHCASCEILIGEEIKKIDGVTEVKISHRRGEAEVSYKGKKPSDLELHNAVRNAGYQVGQKDKLPWISKDAADYKDLMRAAAILFAVYLVAKWLNIFDMNVDSSSNSGIFVSLVVGLVAGVSTCMALIGGLVLGLSARHAERHPEATSFQKFRPHLYFNLGRIGGYAVLGGLVGFLGAAFKPSNNLLGFLTVVVGGVMIFFGLKLIEIFPVLKDKSITLPTSIAKFFGLNKEIKEYSNKSAMLTGALTFFLPCGFTQAMQLYAVSTGSFWQGFAIMGLFAVGTAPGLLGIGGLTSVFKGRRARTFYMTAGLAVILLGWVNIANGSRLFGSVASASEETSKGGEQVVNMTLGRTGYSPNVFTVEKGKQVKWVITSNTSFSCGVYLVMPKYGINKTLKVGENVIYFTPKEVGEIPFSCSMGMYRGKFVVVESGSKVTPATTLNSPVGGGCGAGGASGGCGGGGSAGGCGASGGGCGGCGGGAQAPVQTQQGSVTTKPSVNDPTLKEQVINSTYTFAEDVVPNSFTVKKGQPVRYTIKVKENGYGCMSTVMIPGLYDDPELLRAGKDIVMTFTPTEKGTYMITCAMGVPRGEIKVID